MAATRMTAATKFSPVKNRATAKSAGLKSPDALGYATRLIYQVCCLAGSFNFIEEHRDEKLCAAIERRDNAALFNRLLVDFSFQGISNEIAVIPILSEADSLGIPKSPGK